MIKVQVSFQYQTSDFDERVIKTKTSSVCKLLGLENLFVDIALLDDEAIKKANNEFLKHNYLTDVISFNLSDDSESKKVFELLVNGELAEREAFSRGHSALAELMLYITHGLLHNLGYDDSSEILAEKMHKKEDELLKNVGFGPVFNKKS